MQQSSAPASEYRALGPTRRLLRLKERQELRNTIAMAMPSPDTVASALADPNTTIATLDALEQHHGPHDPALALAAAPALTDLLCLDAAAVPHALYQRCLLYTSPSPRD